MASFAGQHPSTTFIRHQALPLIVVVLIVLAGAPLFAGREAPALALQAPYSIAFGLVSGSGDSSIPSSTSMLAAPENPEFDGVLPGNDADTGNEDDDTSDPPDVLGMFSPLILLLLCGKPRLACHEETEKLSSICCSILQRPG